MINESKSTTSWHDLMRQRVPDWDKKRAESERKRKLEEGGCLSRSLSSVLGVPLTREQEDLRLTQLDGGIDIFDTAFELRNKGNDVDVTQLIRSAIEEEQQIAVEYVLAVQSQKDTPAGRVMQSMKISYEQLTPSQIRETVKGGGQVVLCEVVHAAHVVPDGEDGNIFKSLSDNGASLRLKDYPVKVLVFRKRNI